jgi:fatty-acyl-CoA synthase
VTGVTPTPTFNIADLMELVSAEIPDRLAVVSGDDRLTFGQLDERTNRVASHLVGVGIRPEDRVAIYSWNRSEWIESMFGCFKARAVAVNVNYRYTAEELHYLLENSSTRALIVERSFVPVVEAVVDRLPDLRHVVVLDDGSDTDLDGLAERLGDQLDTLADYEDALGAASPDPLGIQRSSDDLYVLYTGGTTGMPKGVMWRHEDLFFAALGGGGYGQPDIEAPEEIVERIAPPEGALRSLVLAPVMHGAAQWGMIITLLAGGSVTVSTARGFDPREAWRLVEQEGSMSMLVVGDAMARPLAEALDDLPPERAGRPYDTSTVINIGSGGAVFSSAVKQQLLHHIPNLIITDSFGASEMGAAGTTMDSGGTAASFPHNDFMSVLDDDLRPCPPGVIGRLARRGHIPLGYLGDEAKTAAVFPTDEHGVRWSIPGDFCRIEEDGTITLLGRGSGCINTGGEKVFPEEVEAALKDHPDVFDVLVVGIPDDRFGQKVAAIVEPRPGHAVTLESLAEHARTHVAGYKVPRALRVVERIGRTPSGKADHKWAARQFEEPELEEARP